MEEKQQRPHLLAIPCPAQGHINPMLQLCKRLASTGVYISFLISHKKEDFLATEHRASGEYLRFLYLPVPVNFTPEMTPLQYVLMLEEILKVEVPDIVRDVMYDDSLPRISCILTDVAIVGVQHIARELGILKASLSTFSSSWLCIQSHLGLLEENGLLPVKGSDRIIDFIPGLPAISGRDLPVPLQEADVVNDPDFSLRRRRIDKLKDEDWVFVNSFHALETSQFNEYARNILRFLPIGPLLPLSAFDQTNKQLHDNEQRSGFWKEDLSCLKWLDEQPAKSVIYISFGSLASASTDEIKELHTGLVQSGYRFLWVRRPNNSSEVVALNNGSNSKIVVWAPQLKVLKHPSVAAFLTHCGWNSVLESVVAGVPILGRPFAYEQSLNCALAVDVWKIGSRLPSRPDSVTVANSVKDIMGEAGQAWRDNVGKLSLAAKDAVSSRAPATFLFVHVQVTKRSTRGCLTQWSSLYKLLMKYYFKGWENWDLPATI